MVSQRSSWSLPRVRVKDWLGRENIRRQRTDDRSPVQGVWPEPAERGPQTDGCVRGQEGHPGGAVVKNPLSNAGGAGPVPGQGRPRVPHTSLLLSRFSRVRLCATPQTAAHQAPRPWDSPGKNTGVGCHWVQPNIFFRK